MFKTITASARDLFGIGANFGHGHHNPPAAKDIRVDSCQELSEEASRAFAGAYELDRQGKHDRALRIYKETVEKLEQNYAQARNDKLIAKGKSTSGKATRADHISPSYIGPQTLAEIATAHGVELYKLGRLESALASFRRASELLEGQVSHGASRKLIESLALALSWQALMQRRLGRAEKSRPSYESCIALMPQLITFSPKDRRIQLKQVLASTLLGYSKALSQLGHEEEAKEVRGESIAVFKALSSMGETLACTDEVPTKVKG